MNQWIVLALIWIRKEKERDNMSNEIFTERD